jgi:tetratricopeptide (TPR) repeat protein
MWISLANKAETLRHMGRLNEALNCYNKASQISESLKDRHGTFNCGVGIATIYLIQKDLVKAKDIALRMLKLAEETGSKMMIASANSLYGNVARNDGDPSAVYSFHLKAIRECEALGHQPNDIAGMHIEAALDCMEFNDAEKMRSHIAEAQRHLSSISVPKFFVRKYLEIVNAQCVAKWGDKIVAMDAIKNLTLELNSRGFHQLKREAEKIMESLH